MAEVDTFGATKLDIEQYVEHRINEVVEAELTVGRVSALLSTLDAIELATRRMVEISRQGRQAEQAHATLAARLEHAEPSEANQLRERIDDLALHLQLIAASRSDLAARIERLAKSLRG